MEKDFEIHRVPPWCCVMLKCGRMTFDRMKGLLSCGTSGGPWLRDRHGGVVFFGSESLRRPAEERTDMMALI